MHLLMTSTSKVYRWFSKCISILFNLKVVDFVRNPLVLGAGVVLHFVVFHSFPTMFCVQR